MQLPSDLLALGAGIQCTPYGHVIMARAGWIWTQPGSHAPVWIPAQMVRDNPKPLGHQAHFTRIETGRASPGEVAKARAGFRRVFPGEKFADGMLRLDVRGNAGNALMLIFTELGGSRWGIWCAQGECRSDTIFMVLDMSRRPSR